MAMMNGVVVDAVRVAASALLFWVALLVWRAARRYASFRKLELAIPGPASIPVIGNALDLRGVNENNAFSLILSLWGGRSTELSRFSMFNRLFVFVTDPADVEKVVRDKRFHEKPTFMYGALSEILGEGLLTLKGRRWTQHRAIMLPTFHVAVLERFVDVFAEEAVAMVERLRPLLGKNVEVGDQLREVAARSALRTSMASELDEDDEPTMQAIIASLGDCLNAINLRSWRPWLWPRAMFRLTSGAKYLDAFNERTESVIQKIIKRRTAELVAIRDTTAAVDKSRRKSFIDLMLEAKLDGRMDLTHREIIDESKTLIAASLETSVTEMSFTFKMLSIFPDVQDRVLAEIDEVFGTPDDGRLVTPEDLPRLDYLERTIKETMRLFPSSSLVARGVQEETELSGKVLPADTTLIINIFGMHRDPRHFPEPMRFDPDRFLPEQSASRHPFSYLPFSAGPRSCIGQRYAMMQMKTVIATVLRNYRVLPGPDGWTSPEQYPLNFEIVLRLLGGFHVTFEPRHRAQTAETAEAETHSSVRRRPGN